MKMIAIAAAASLMAAPSVHAAERPGGLSVVKPWSRPAPAGTTGAGFLTLVNGGKAPAVLTGAQSPLAAKVEMHTSSMASGVMRMTREDTVTVPAGGQVVFAPGGRHLMLVGLKASLKAGDRAPLTLLFADGRRLKVQLAVGDGGAAPMADHMRH